MIFEQLFDPETSTYTYLIGDEAERVCVLIDPVREQVNRDLDRIRALGLKLLRTLETHIHADHVTGGAELGARTGSIPVLSETSPVSCEAVRVHHGSEVSVGNICIHVLATPGHTPESVSFLVDGSPMRVLTGDALLIGGCGRTDFQGGDAGALYDSVHHHLFTLPDETLVFPAHDYQGRTSSTIGREKESNSRFVGRTREEFVDFMNRLDLPPPKKIQEALPANLACGKSS